MDAVARGQRTPAGDLKVRWFERWHPVLDEALQVLPELETCPHQLYRMLLGSPARTPKRVALVTEDRRPVAVAGLRRRKWFWEPVVDAVCSIRQAMPARDGYLFSSLSALGLDIWTGGYERRPQADAPLRRVFPLPFYRLDCRADFEQYWRRAGNIKAVKAARARTRGYSLEVDAPGAAAWVIRNWDQKWRDHPARETIAVDDQLLAADYYEAHGRMHTLRLLQDGEPVAGHIFQVHRRSVVFTRTYRDARHEWQGVGTRLLDLAFQWAADSGFERIDLGSGHAYKQHWAPEDGARWYANVCPMHIYLPKQSLRLVRRFASAGADRIVAATRVGQPGQARPQIDH